MKAYGVSNFVSLFVYRPPLRAFGRYHYMKIVEMKFMKMMKSICAVMLLSAGVLFFSGCGKSNSKSNGPIANGTPPVEQAAVGIQNSAFGPATVHVVVGGTVVWTNKDDMAHTVTDLNGSFDSGSIAAGQTYTRTFNTAGTYTYHCTIHPAMANAIVIVGN